MPDTAQEAALAENLSKFNSAVGLVKDFTKGDATVDVVGSDGSYPSLAKLTTQAQHAVDNIIYQPIINSSNEDMVFGQAVYSTQGIYVDLANAASITKKTVIGLIIDDLVVSQSGAGRVQSTSTLTGTVAQWEVATGMVGGLVKGMEYFLDTVSGRVTPFPPDAENQYLCPLGYALSTTQLNIRIDRPIKL